jgi:tol-pal system protein YbgF
MFVGDQVMRLKAFDFSWRPLAMAVGAALALCQPAVSHAGLFGDDEARTAILQMREQRTQDLAAANAREAALTAQIDQLKRSLLDINAQLELLRSELAKQRGQSEVLARDVSEVQRKQKDLQHGMDERVRKLEPQTVSIDGKTIQADADEKREFEEALAKMRQTDFAGGLSALNAFTKKYPNTGYRESVLYWVGNAQYGLRDYKGSIDTFRQLLALAPQHYRAPEALLSIANCHSEIKEPKLARKALEDLVKSYPDAEAAQVARERLAATTPAPAPTAAGNAKSKSRI